MQTAGKCLGGKGNKPFSSLFLSLLFSLTPLRCVCACVCAPQAGARTAQGHDLFAILKHFNTVLTFLHLMKYFCGFFSPPTCTELQKQYSFQGKGILAGSRLVMSYVIARLRSSWLVGNGVGVRHVQPRFCSLSSIPN